MNGPKDADGIASSVDPDQTALEQFDLVYTDYSDLSVGKLRKITGVCCGSLAFCQETLVLVIHQTMMSQHINMYTSYRKLVNHTKLIKHKLGEYKSYRGNEVKCFLNWLDNSFAFLYPGIALCPLYRKETLYDAFPNFTQQ